eukprot:5399613-Alexandrium_andersonii.AAC.1
MGTASRSGAGTLEPAAALGVKACNGPGLGMPGLKGGTPEPEPSAGGVKTGTGPGLRGMRG